MDQWSRCSWLVRTIIYDVFLMIKPYYYRLELDFIDSP